MENALPTPTPHRHPAHDHGHTHHIHDANPHHHAHPHQHEVPAPAVAQESGFSLIGLSSRARLACTLPAIGALWLLTLWAVQNG